MKTKLDDIIIAYIGRQELAAYHAEPSSEFQLCKQAIKDLIDELVGPKANTEGKTALQLFTEIQDRAEQLL